MDDKNRRAKEMLRFSVSGLRCLRLLNITSLLNIDLAITDQGQSKQEETGSSFQSCVVSCLDQFNLTAPQAASSGIFGSLIRQ